MQEFYLDEMNIHSCIGCLHAGNDSKTPCSQKDDMDQIYAAFSECDVVVFASPVYFWTVTGPLKTVADRQLEKEKLDQILEAAMAAPMAKNNQPQRIYVLQSKEALEKLDTLTHCRYGAGTVLLFTYNQDEDWKNPLEEGTHSGVEDVSIAASYVMLQAIELGVYTTWCNYFADSELEKAFQIPENEKAVPIMPKCFFLIYGKRMIFHSRQVLDRM